MKWCNNMIKNVETLNQNWGKCFSSSNEKRKAWYERDDGDDNDDINISEQISTTHPLERQQLLHVHNSSVGKHKCCQSINHCISSSDHDRKAHQCFIMS